MKVGFLMEALSDASREASTSLLLVQEACRRGHEVYHFMIDTLSMDNGTVIANAARVNVDVSRDDYYRCEEYQPVNLEIFDIVWMRQEPPVDMRYISALYTLDHLKSRGVYVTNDPAAILRVPEKMSIFNFLDLIPPTLVSKDEQTIRTFFEVHGDVVVKPLYEFSGIGINKYESFETYKNEHNTLQEQLMFQKYLPHDAENKRVIIIGEKIIAANQRLISDGHIVFQQTDQKIPYSLNDRDEFICKSILPFIKKNNLDLVGIDIIGDYLIEINVTCTGSFVSMNSNHSKKLESDLWDIVEAKSI